MASGIGPVSSLGPRYRSLSTRSRRPSSWSSANKQPQTIKYVFDVLQIREGGDGVRDGARDFIAVEVKSPEQTKALVVSNKVTALACTQCHF
jgi:hypothetical protein